MAWNEPGSRFHDDRVKEVCANQGGKQHAQDYKSELNFNGLPTRSSCLSDHLLFSLAPCRWRERSDLGDLGRWQAREQIFQIIERVDPVPPATAQQGINHRTAFPGFGMPDEQKILFSKGTGPNRILD